MPRPRTIRVPGQAAPAETLDADEAAPAAQYQPVESAGPAAQPAEVEPAAPAEALPAQEITGLPQVAAVDPRGISQAVLTAEGWLCPIPKT